MPVAMPCLELTICLVCKHEWNAFFPIGKPDVDYIECPKCHKFGGKAK